MIAFLYRAGCDISLSVEPDENQIGLQKMRLQLRYNQVTSLTKLRKSYRQKLINWEKTKGTR